jgi:hypothetical protein
MDCFVACAPRNDDLGSWLDAIDPMVHFVVTPLRPRCTTCQRGFHLRDYNAAFNAHFNSICDVGTREDARPLAAFIVSRLCSASVDEIVILHCNAPLLKKWPLGRHLYNGDAGLFMG